MQSTSFFEVMVISVKEIIETRLKNSTFKAKHVRKAMKISGKDRSKVSFIALALAELEKRGILTLISENNTREYVFSRDTTD